MLQALEREPQEDISQIYDSSPAPGMMPPNENGVEGGPRQYRRENPHKYLLYKPTFSQFLVFLTSGFKELPVNGVLLLFLSADGCFINSKQPEDSKFKSSTYLGDIAWNKRSIYSVFVCSWLRLWRRDNEH